jgi:hypothetical protein
MISDENICIKETEKIIAGYLFQSSDVVLKIKNGEVVSLRIKRKYGKFTRPIFKYYKNV